MAEHTHTGDRLHFACPACYDNVRHAELLDDLAEATEFHCTVMIRAFRRTYGVEIVLPWPARWAPKEVVHWYLLPEPRGEIVEAVDAFLAREFAGDDEGLDEAFATVQYVDLRKGLPVKADPPPNPMEGQPTLFG